MKCTVVFPPLDDTVIELVKKEVVLHCSILSKMDNSCRRLNGLELEAVISQDYSTLSADELSIKYCFNSKSHINTYLNPKDVNVIDVSSFIYEDASECTLFRGDTDMSTNITAGLSSRLLHVELVETLCSMIGTSVPENYPLDRPLSYLNFNPINTHEGVHWV